MNDINNCDCQQIVENLLEETSTESPGLQAARRAANSPEAKALKAANKENGHLAQARRVNQEWRSGPGREDRNRSERIAYAEKVLKMEGRIVQPYEKATPARRAEQNREAKKRERLKAKDAFAALSPAEQRAIRDNENEAQKRRRAAAKQRKLDEAQRELEAAKGFGEF